MSEPRQCTYCSEVMMGTTIHLKPGEEAHPHCYYLENPNESYVTFPDLLAKVLSQFLRDLLVEHIPPVVQDHILNEYNKEGHRRQRELELKLKRVLSSMIRIEVFSQGLSQAVLDEIFDSVQEVNKEFGPVGAKL